MTAKYIVKERSRNVPTWVKPGWGPNGWKRSTKWGPWRTVSKHESACAAGEAVRSQKYTTGFTRAAVFFKGRRLSDSQVWDLRRAEGER